MVEPQRCNDAFCWIQVAVLCVGLPCNADHQGKKDQLNIAKLQNMPLRIKRFQHLDAATIPCLKYA